MRGFLGARESARKRLVDRFSRSAELTSVPNTDCGLKDCSQDDRDVLKPAETNMLLL